MRDGGADNRNFTAKQIKLHFFPDYCVIYIQLKHIRAKFYQFFHFKEIAIKVYNNIYYQSFKQHIKNTFKMQYFKNILINNIIPNTPKLITT